MKGHGLACYLSVCSSMMQEGSMFSNQDLIVIFQSVDRLTFADDCSENQWNI
jgi:hypothetical protein